MDIAHAAPFAYANKVKAGTYEDLKGAEVVIVTAGANQKPGETRIDLLGRNAKIFESIISQVAKYAPDTILLITSNPADIMTEVAIKLSGFPRERVIGSGTVLRHLPLPHPARLPSRGFAEIDSRQRPRRTRRQRSPCLVERRRRLGTD